MVRLFNFALAAAIALGSLFVPGNASATIVRFSFDFGALGAGAVDVRLYDTATPFSVDNFLAYLNADSWDSSFVHRSAPGFVVQGGGYDLNPGILTYSDITSLDPILNEPGITNIRGTLSYAKMGPPDGEQPTPETINSATNEWFFNLGDNAANLDFQNGGFTVFGRVLDEGMSLIDAIASLSRVNFGGPFNTVPVTDLQTVLNQQDLFNAQAVILSDVVVLPVTPGDYTRTNGVDNADLALWRTDYSSQIKAEADGNGNGVVDGADFLVWQRGFVAAALPVANSVPEPTSLAVAVAAFVTTAICRSVRRRLH